MWLPPLCPFYLFVLIAVGGQPPAPSTTGAKFCHFLSITIMHLQLLQIPHLFLSSRYLEQSLDGIPEHPRLPACIPQLLAAQ